MSGRNVIHLRPGARRHSGPEADTEIVLSSSGSPMPAGLAGDWESEATAGDHATPSTGQGGEERSRVRAWQSLLALLRRPEQWLWRRYARTGLHQRLHHSCQWYRDIEDDWRLGLKLERAYAARARPRYRVQRFVAGNLTVTVLICLITIYAGRTGVAGLIQAPVLLDQVLEAPAVVVAGKDPTPAVPAARILPALPEADLNHCSLSPVLRKSLSHADRATRHAVLTEVNRFHTRYARSGIERQWRQRAQQRGLTQDFAQRMLPLVTRYLTELQRDRSRRLSQREELLRSLNADQSSRLHDVTHVNRRIQQRDSLERIESTLASGPSPAQLSALGDTIEAIRKKPGDAVATPPVASPPSPAATAWAAMAVAMPPEQMRQVLESLFQRDFSVPIAAGVSKTPTVNRYRLGTVISALNALERLLAMQNETPTTLPALDRDQAGANDRLVGLLALHPTDGLLDYRGCLDELPASTQLSASR